MDSARRCAPRARTTRRSWSRPISRQRGRTRTSNSPPPGFDAHGCTNAVERMDARERRMYRDVRMPRSALTRTASDLSLEGAVIGCAGAADVHGCTNAVERKCCTGMCECRGRRDALERRCAGAADARAHPDCVRASAAHGCANAAGARMRRSGVPQGEAKQPPLPLRERVGVRGPAARCAFESRIEHLMSKFPHGVRFLALVACRSSSARDRARGSRRRSGRLSSARTEVHRVGEARGRAERH